MLLFCSSAPLKRTYLSTYCGSRGKNSSGQFQFWMFWTCVKISRFLVSFGGFNEVGKCYSSSTLPELTAQSGEKLFDVILFHASAETLIQARNLASIAP